MDIDAAYRRIAALEHLLERAILLPGLNKRIGLDSILGLVPGVGDALAGALGVYLIVEARRLGASKRLMARMLWNVAIDTGLGAIPVVGDLWDLMFKSNTKNLRLLKAHLDKHAGVIDGDVVRQPIVRVPGACQLAICAWQNAGPAGVTL